MLNVSILKTQAQIQTGTSDEDSSYVRTEGFYIAEKVSALWWTNSVMITVSECF